MAQRTKTARRMGMHGGSETESPETYPARKCSRNQPRAKSRWRMALALPNLFSVNSCPESNRRDTLPTSLSPQNSPARLRAPPHSCPRLPPAEPRHRLFLRFDAAHKRLRVGLHPAVQHRAQRLAQHTSPTRLRPAPRHSRPRDYPRLPIPPLRLHRAPARHAGRMAEGRRRRSAVAEPRRHRAPRRLQNLLIGIVLAPVKDHGWPISSTSGTARASGIPAALFAASTR
jgi:hypothetical protein